MNLEIMRVWRSEMEISVSADKQYMQHSSEDIDIPSHELAGNASRGMHTPHVSLPQTPLWYSIIDDDGYVFVDSAKAMLSSHDAYFYDRFVRRKNRRQGMIPASNPNSDREEHRRSVNEAMMWNPNQVPATVTGQLHYYGTNMFLNGGPGYFFNHRALSQLTAQRIDDCILKNREITAGDAMGGVCLQSAGAHAIASFGVFNEDIEECFQRRCNMNVPFPVSFHRQVRLNGTIYALEMLYRLRADRGELVHWEDLRILAGRSDFKKRN